MDMPMSNAVPTFALRSPLDSSSQEGLR